MDLKIIIVILITACVGLSFSQTSPGAAATAINPANMTPQQMAKAKKTLTQQCNRCRMCESGMGNGLSHPCESFICKFSTFVTMNVCSMCREYHLHCKTTCKNMCPMLNQIPAGK